MATLINLLGIHTWKWGELYMWCVLICRKDGSKGKKLMKKNCFSLSFPRWTVPWYISLKASRKFSVIFQAPKSGASWIKFLVCWIVLTTLSPQTPLWVILVIIFPCKSPIQQQIFVRLWFKVSQTNYSGREKPWDIKYKQVKKQIILKEKLLCNDIKMDFCTEIFIWPISYFLTNNELNN